MRRSFLARLFDASDVRTFASIDSLTRSVRPLAARRSSAGGGKSGHPHQSMTATRVDTQITLRLDPHTLMYQFASELIGKAHEIKVIALPRVPFLPTFVLSLSRFPSTTPSRRRLLPDRPCMMHSGLGFSRAKTLHEI